MEKKYVYTPDQLHEILCKVCETDTQKRKYKVVQDLKFYFNLSENEALTVWNEAIDQGVLTLYSVWEQDEYFKTYSYDGNGIQHAKITTYTDTDVTDTGVSRTAHNAPPPPNGTGLSNGSRYGKDSRKETLLRNRRKLKK